MAPPASAFVRICTVLAVSAHSALAAQASPTCDERALDPASYALTTGRQANTVDHEPNVPSIWIAERALRLDPDNLLAHGILARQYVVEGVDAALAEAAWQTVLDHGGAVVWTATLYDVDARSNFLVAFDRSALRVYRYGELAGPFRTHLGAPTLSSADRERFWRAWSGCVDPSARAEAIVPWSNVREIKAGNWVLYFKLTRPFVVRSDRGKEKALKEIKVNLHGPTGSLEVHTSVDPIDRLKVNVRTFGIGPLDYQNRVRYTLVKFVDPAGRIALPKASRSAGW
jgi:hypothetical protein